MPVADNKKTTAKSEETRAALLRAARRVFAWKGVTNSRVSDIVSAAGVSHGTFYVYFKNKEDILYEVVRPVLDELYEAVSGSWDERDLPGSVEHTIRTFLDAFSRNADIMPIMLYGEPRNMLVGKLYYDASRRFQRRIRKNLAKAAEANQIKDINIDITAFALGCMVEDFAYRWFCTSPPDWRRSFDFDEVCKILADIWCNTIYAGGSGMMGSL
ncbi:MAG: TetR/AcrR family transcriptional regulator [Actinobacteria bacterium]|jgi:AcrR family transcriptional regulator|nr:MAG: TetR/AcrR family transcriptional regulator [Actinomycetota bacterium]